MVTSSIKPDSTYADAKSAGADEAPTKQYVNVDERLSLGDMFDRTAAAVFHEAAVGAVASPPSTPGSGSGNRVFNTFAVAKAKSMTEQEFVEHLFYKSRPGSGRNMFVRTPSNRREELEVSVEQQAPMLSNENIERGAIAGQGSFGTVYKGVLRDAGHEVPVAIKELKPGIDEKAKIHFLQEAYLLAQLNHPNIIAFVGGIFKEEPQ